jgi:hypothetical protein
VNLLFLLFAAICFVTLAAIVARPARLFEFPYFMTCAFGAFMLPQGYGIATGGWAREGWMNDLFLMAILCLGACWFGYRHAPRPGFLLKLDMPLHTGRFVVAGFGLILLGQLFDYLITTLPPEARVASTGPITIYLFFSNQAFTGFAICLYAALLERKPIYWIAAAIGSSIPLLSILNGRREPTALFILSILLTLYFLYRAVPPRLPVLAALIGTAIAIPATEQYRQSEKGNPLETLASIDFMAPLKQFADVNAISELKNAMYLIQAVRVSGDYQFGTYYWDRLVFSFVPAQIVGREVKQSLMINDPSSDMRELLQGTLGYVAPTGTTPTGLGDAFRQFWFAGSLVFAAMAYLFRHLWDASHLFASPLLHIFYVQAMVAAMRSVTHQSANFLPGILYSVAFLAIAGYFAKARASEVRAAELRAAEQA